MLFNILSHRLAFLALTLALVLSCNPANALPLRVRQNAATTVQTVHTTQTVAGPLTETCVITLTPITDSNGKPAVEEVKKCSLAYSNQGSGGGGGGSNTTTTGTTTLTGNPIPTSSGTSTTTSGSITTTGTSSSSVTVSESTTSTSSTVATPGPNTTSTSTSESTPTSTSTSASTAGSTSSGSGIHVNGVSTVAGSPTPSGTTTTAATSSSTTTSSTKPATNTSAGQSSTPPPSGTTAPDVNTSSSSPAAAAASAAAAEQPSDSAAAAFQVPGKKLSVLPIGLGVFAGISVIALIVVGLVTYERTKYRKAFRARKLAESGGAMGYGGMGQRP